MSKLKGDYYYQDFVTGSRGFFEEISSFLFDSMCFLTGSLLTIRLLVVSGCNHWGDLRSRDIISTRGWHLNNYTISARRNYK